LETIKDVAALFAPHHQLAASLLSLSATEGDDGAHDLSHLLRVWSNVKTIARHEGGDLAVLTAATLLHDCVNIEKDDPRRAQASQLSASHAATLLAQLEVMPNFADAVCHAIEAHSFSANIPPATLEARILQDADRLDAIGVVGIARCFFVSGRMGRPLYDPDDVRALNRDLDDSAYALDHFQTKLLGLSAGFQTAHGGKLAEQRHQRLVTFYEQFIEEVGG
jgi:uncharacterized protein